MLDEEEGGAKTSRCKNGVAQKRADAKTEWLKNEPGACKFCRVVLQTVQGMLQTVQGMLQTVQGGVANFAHNITNINN